MAQKKRKKPTNREIAKNNRTIIREIEPVIKELKKRGIKHNDTYTVGLGDVVESTLQQFGITEERFKAWFGLKECNCEARKKWLNSVFYWHRKSK